MWTNIASIILVRTAFLRWRGRACVEAINLACKANSLMLETTRGRCCRTRSPNSDWVGRQGFYKNTIQSCEFDRSTHVNDANMLTPWATEDHKVRLWLSEAVHVASGLWQWKYEFIYENSTVCVKFVLEYVCDVWFMGRVKFPIHSLVKARLIQIRDAKTREPSMRIHANHWCKTSSFYW